MHFLKHLLRGLQYIHIPGSATVAIFKVTQRKVAKRRVGNTVARSRGDSTPFTQKIPLFDKKIVYKFGVKTKKMVNICVYRIISLCYWSK